ncbi:DUF2807 domain-containing protein [Parvicella tangerina]|uniref:Putative auto-transporter adhesin head GIN domain-containing protein n=1 Tax=Parvicella tangerina TaxID=2829795 RepID=A0A916NAF0_9FLAO|nr:DUF2807 domain-containing protein [Parvicella tangerina]CAG5080573.1 hypothetical protein CRYO30217_01381 [Parvicella tangerina]
MKWLSLIILTLLISACEKENRCFDQPGELTTITRTINSTYKTISIYDDLNVNFLNDSLSYVAITGGKNMVNNVVLSESGSHLTLSNDNKCLFMSNQDEIQITVHYSSMEELLLFGYGVIEITDKIQHNLHISGYDCYSTIALSLNNDSTTIALEGSPQITAEGQSQYLYAYCIGSGNYHLENLATQTCHGHNKSIGDFHLKASKAYILELRSRGDIYLADTTGTTRFITQTGEGSIYYE